MVVCSICQQDRSAKRFTKTELRTNENPRCKQCLRAAEAERTEEAQKAPETAEPTAPTTETAIPEVPERVCEHCNRPTERLLRCARCKMTFYCSRDCQKAAWSDHRPECRRRRLEVQASPETEEGNALLLSARQGDNDEVLAAIESGAMVDYRNDQGNTALHYAAANGHTEVVNTLAQAGAAHTPNGSGNLPLHWAVQNGHTEVVRAILEAYQDIDVLAQNEFGRGSLTESIAKGVTPIIDMLLSHQSATEERLLDMNSTAQASTDPVPSEYHIGDPPLTIFEIPTPEEVFNVDEGVQADATGFTVWGSSVILGRWVCTDAIRPLLAGRTVVELGSGCGVAGLAAAAYTDAARVALTDAKADTLVNLQANATQNEELMGNTVLTVEERDWTAYEQECEPVDVLLGSDLVYDVSLVNNLVATITRGLTPGGIMLYVGPRGARAGAEELEAAIMAVPEFTVCSTVAPEELLAVPGPEGAAAALYPGEMAHTEYICLLIQSAASSQDDAETQEGEGNEQE